MKANEMRELAEDELIRKKAELKDQLFKLRFQHELGQLENAAKLQTIRKDIARIETLLTEMRSKAKA
ncbi:MAG: 50S ribosomal protein L29 [Candidatus Aminicenantes bacterium]|jgi:large subunit ribosomal protein L29|nr:50S ribosomal protein L29 [Candidatus Aminicenantes bacterium]